MIVPSDILVEEDAREAAMTSRILHLLKGARVGPATAVSGMTVEEQKRCLRLAVKKGGHVKTFDAGYGGGEEWYVAPTAGCPIDCEYCYLQEYLDDAVPTIFVNVDDMIAELRRKMVASNGAPTRVHAGHLSDALALDRLTGVSRRLIGLFREFPSTVLELRTKTADVDGLVEAYGEGAPGNVVASWTMSPQEAIRRYEHGSASLSKRIDAAAHCVGAGLQVGVRMDPMVLFPGWRAACADMIARICGSLDTERIESWVLGCLRFRPELAAVVARRFPGSNLMRGEFVRCPDGKYRYFRPLRLGAYLHVAHLIRERDAEARMELCMETPEVNGDFRSAF